MPIAPINLIVFKCELLTPFFGGAGEQLEVALTGSTLKGAIRRWWRTMQAVQDNNYKKLVNEENAIFGDNSTHQSKVFVKIEAIDKEKKINESGEKKKEKREAGNNVKEQKVPDFLKKEYVGINYLLYPMGVNGNKEYYDSSTSFRVEFRSYNMKYLKQTINAFLMLSFFGGLGAKTNRYGGNFAIKKVGSLDKVLKKKTEGYIEKIEKKLLAAQQNQTGKELSIHDFVDCEKLPGKNQDSRPYLSDYKQIYNADIVVLKKDYWSSIWYESINAVGSKFRELRSSEDWKHELKKGVFGLPLKIHYTSSIGYRGSPKDIRSASSLVFRLVKIGDDFVPIMINYHSRLLPKNITTIIERKKHEKETNSDTSSILEDNREHRVESYPITDINHYKPKKDFLDYLNR